MTHSGHELIAIAPGKVILCGEHAVVHGKSAIACSLGLMTTCSVRALDSLVLIMDNFGFRHSWNLKEFSDQIVPANNIRVDSSSIDWAPNDTSFLNR